jgi:hypothetical protein
MSEGSHPTSKESHPTSETSHPSEKANRFTTQSMQATKALVRPV